MTEVRDRRSAVRNQRAEINRRDAERAELFLCALCASVVKSISDLRVLISGLCALLFVLSFPAVAQQANKVPRVGYLAVNSPSAERNLVEAFQQGLRGLGWGEGQNSTTDYRF